jgi:hypothetical protein
MHNWYTFFVVFVLMLAAFAGAIVIFTSPEGGNWLSWGLLILGGVLVLVDSYIFGNIEDK